MNFTAHASQLALACNYFKNQLQVHYQPVLQARLNVRLKTCEESEIYKSMHMAYSVDLQIRLKWILLRIIASWNFIRKAIFSGTSAGSVIPLLKTCP